jgi:hypothetical protein
MGTTEAGYIEDKYREIDGRGMNANVEVDWTCPGCKQSYFLPANIMAREQKHHQDCVA